MARQLNRLSARKAMTITKPGRHADGGGLYLVVGPGASRRWVFLYPLARQADGDGSRRSLGRHVGQMPEERRQKRVGF